MPSEEKGTLLLILCRFSERFLYIYLREQLSILAYYNFGKGDDNATR